MRHFLKPLSFLPAIFMMYIIFGFSSEQGVDSAALSYKVSHKLVEAVDTIGEFDWPHERIDAYADKVHTLVRKTAHVTEYTLLAMTVSLPLYVYGLHGILLMLLAGGFCVAFAALDEYHQTFVAGRSGQLRDVLIDSIGIFAGIMIVRIIGFIGRKTLFRPKMKKRGRY